MLSCDAAQRRRSDVGHTLGQDAMARCTSGRRGGAALAAESREPVQDDRQEGGHRDEPGEKREQLAAEAARRAAARAAHYTGTRDQQGTIRGPAHVTRALAPDTRAPTVVEAASEPLPSDERARRETHPHTADTHHRSHAVSTTNPGDTRTPSTDTSRRRGRSRDQQGPSEDRRRAYA